MVSVVRKTAGMQRALPDVASQSIMPVDIIAVQGREAPTPAIGPGTCKP